MALTELHELAEVCDLQATGNTPIDMIEHLPCLPCQQTLFSGVRIPWRRMRIRLPPQHRDCFEDRAVCGLLVMKLPDGHIEPLDHLVHPFMRQFRTLSLHRGGHANNITTTRWEHRFNSISVSSRRKLQNTLATV